MVNRVATELRRVGNVVKEDNSLAILNGLNQEYAAESRILEGGDDDHKRAPIEQVILNQYERLRAEKSEARAKALAVVATPGHQNPQPAPSKSKWRKQR